MPARKVALQLRLDETTHKKLKVIAEMELRSLNAQLEYFISRGLQDYEKKNGTIQPDDSSKY